MNKKGFTLIELIGVITILSIIVIIAIPNINGVFNKSKSDQLISDSRKFVSLVEYEIRTNKNINKPSDNTALKIRLSYLNTNDILKNADGEDYDTDNSYVIVTKESDFLVYYVNLVVKKSNNNYDGIILQNSEEFTSNNIDNKESKYNKVEKNITNSEINRKYNRIVGLKSVTTY